MAHLLAVYQNKVQVNSRIISKLKRQKDAQLQAVISQLLLLEAQLRREQKGIVGQLAQRDHVIAAQRQEIDRLRRDNRRLINKLKKFSEMCLESDVEHREPRLKISRVESTEESNEFKQRSQPHSSGSQSSRKSSSGLIRVATSVSELINCSSDSTFTKPRQSHYHTTSNNNQSTCSLPPPETVNPNVASVRATTDRVFHKPPIAEKPRLTGRLVRGQQLSQKGQQLIRTYGGKQCTIVSTISRLLEEESDATTTGSSGSSEPSSPEATLKPATPRVIRLARQFEEGFNCQNLVNHSSQASSDSSPESIRQDDHSSKSYIMDEYEVTSGYNSDAISDHEYENIHVVTQGSNDSSSKLRQDEDKNEEEEDDNYVILRVVKENTETNNWVDIPEDQHIYSNVEYSSGLLVKEVEEEEEEEDQQYQTESEDDQNSSKSTLNMSGEGKLLETNLDSSNTSGSDSSFMSETLRAAMNVPRSRHNINLIMESDGDHMTENFEEFTLDSLELEEREEEEDQGRGKENLPISEQRRCGDGAETKLDNKMNEGQQDLNGNAAAQAITTNGQYEKFLEATGLSQKSILTPTRMFSNHRSVVKPRDVKHRNKLRAAFSTLSTLEESPVAELLSHL
ncbi:hypothetical protein Pcinc_023451 [Petrolisthes cinctipes]|uniref:Uncharacterized protein n=1 Tax=Petrolisthes cinctipes TaxID=88211 RepID=A0AAE1KF88_PETCI|nr:hypothetical protein Pcinc_023451 [Petrolisthes cinctipes]